MCIRDRIDSTQGDPRYINSLGVLYAKYGLDEKAEEQFNKILKETDYLPALMNMGNLFYIKEDYKKAREYYTRAQKVSPNNPRVLLSIARVNHEIENYGTAREAYSKLKEIAPDLASRFAYLDLRGEEATRAANVAGVKNLVLWEEEE